LIALPAFFQADERFTGSENLNRTLSVTLSLLEGKRAASGKWLRYFNAARPHSTHGLLTPAEAYDSNTQSMKMSA
jgi:transposase InsO family protein